MVYLNLLNYCKEVKKTERERMKMMFIIVNTGCCTEDFSTVK
jgi:hypothetical protein